MGKKITLNILSAAVLAAFSSGVIAAGFALQNQTGSGNGNAFAGAAAAADDAGTIFFNPAGMTYLPQGNNVALAATVLNRSIDFTDGGTANLAIPGPTVYAKGTTGGDAGGTSLIPAAYFSHSINVDLTAGLGLSPTFGNKTEYTSDFIGRFSGYFAELKVINLNPSLAYKVTPMLSLGGGLNYSSAEIEFRQRAPVPVAPPAPEADVRLKGDDKSLGYNLGAMLQVSPATRVGLSYRSKIKFNLEGDLTQTVGGTTTVSGIKADLELPDTYSLALSHRLSDQFELLADYTRTNWSSIQSIVVTSAVSGARVTSLDYNFKDSNRIGLGLNYRMSETLKLRAGVALDKTPVQSAADTTMTLPDSDRTWLSLGARFGLAGGSSVDVGYTHIFFDEAQTARAVKTAGGTTLQTVRGTFETSADILSLQYNQTF